MSTPNSTGDGNGGDQLQLLTVPRSRRGRSTGVGGGAGCGYADRQNCGADSAATLLKGRDAADCDGIDVGGCRKTAGMRWSIASSCDASAGSHVRDQFAAFFQVSDNKLAMKLFGNRLALEKEKLRHRAVGHWVIHPCSSFR